VFHAVYSCGSTTRAAEVLNVSQPSVSKVLVHAEKQLGYALFDRVKGKLIPTHEAKLLFSQVSQVHDSVERLSQVAANLRAMEKGTIRIAATPAFGIDFLPGAIANYREKHGKLMFSLETLRHEELSGALLDSRIDIGLAFDLDNLPGIIGELLGYGEFVVLLPPGTDSGNNESITLQELSGLPFIKLDNQGPLDRILAAHIESSEVKLEPAVIAGSYQLAKALVSHGVGSGIIDNVTAYSRGHDNMIIRRMEPALKFRIAALHIDQEPMSLVCRHFVDHLKDSLKYFLTS